MVFVPVVFVPAVVPFRLGLAPALDDSELLLLVPDGRVPGLVVGDLALGCDMLPARAPALALLLKFVPVDGEGAPAVPVELVPAEPVTAPLAPPAPPAPWANASVGKPTQSAAARAV